MVCSSYGVSIVLETKNFVAPVVIACVGQRVALVQNHILITDTQIGQFNMQSDYLLGVGTPS